MERLTADDLVVLWPDALWPQDIGALALVDGRDLLDPDGRLRLDAIRESVGAGIERAPRLRQVLWQPGRGLGGPLWVDDPEFDLSRHIRLRPLPEPAGEATLLIEVERLLDGRMDRAHPLWQMWLMPGLPGGRVGLFVRMHHAMADGLAGIAILTDLLGARPADPSATRAWTPRPAPTPRELVQDRLHRGLGRWGGRLRRLARPGLVVRRIRTSGSALRGLATAAPTPRTSLDATVGAGRSLAVLRSDLDDVTAIAHATGATVNDVLLTVVAGGLDELLRRRGERVDAAGLPVYVPVSLRPRDRRAHARGNRIAQMVVQIPLGVPDPVERLTLIARATRAAKAEGHPALGTVLGGRLARRFLLRFLDSHPVNVTTADIPGPDRTLALAGAPVPEIFPILPLISRVTLGVAALSYAGRFAVTVVADRLSHPDLPVFTEALARDLAALCGTDHPAAGTPVITTAAGTRCGRARIYPRSASTNC